VTWVRATPASAKPDAKVRSQASQGQCHFGKKHDESAMNVPCNPVNVAILAFAETTASVTFGIYDLMMAAGRDWGFVVDGQPGPALMHPRIVSVGAATFLAANDVPITPQATLAQTPAPQVVCVPELAVPPTCSLGGRFAQEIAWLRNCYAQGATIATACSGALLLAEAGILDGHEATTHWAYCDVMRARYPKVRVRREPALVVSGEGQRLVMAGGGTSWQDLALYLIARFAGVDAAMHVARVNLIDWHAIGQQPFARLARSRQVEDADIARCQTWIADHYNEPSPVSAMVRLSGLPERSFKRRFVQATGMPPLEYVHTLRLEEAKQMLETTAASIEAIAHEAGYEDPGFFSRLFRRKVSLTPVQYRRRFGAMRRALTGSQGH
jgi:transcriptional regulator GlxA family with amidase domain